MIPSSVGLPPLLQTCEFTPIAVGIHPTAAYLVFLAVFPAAEILRAKSPGPASIVKVEAAGDEGHDLDRRRRGHAMTKRFAPKPAPI